jgi:hypothetical protein
MNIRIITAFERTRQTASQALNNVVAEYDACWKKYDEQTTLEFAPDLRGEIYCQLYQNTYK